MYKVLLSYGTLLHNYVLFLKCPSLINDTPGNIFQHPHIRYLCPQVTAKCDQGMRTAFLPTMYTLPFASGTLSSEPSCSRHSWRHCFGILALLLMLEPLPHATFTPVLWHCGNELLTATQASRRKLQKTSRQRHHKMHALAVVSLRAGLLKLQNLGPNKTSFLKRNLHPQTEQNKKS